MKKIHAYAFMLIGAIGLFFAAVTATAVPAAAFFGVTCEVADVSGYDVNKGVHVVALEVRDESGFRTEIGKTVEDFPDCQLANVGFSNSPGHLNGEVDPDDAS